ncbi:MAG: LytTR family DNA-binding domain-containing protein [Pseudomonadota bacterium]
MPSISDELQPYDQAGWQTVAHRYRVEATIAAVVFITLVVTSSNLAQAPFESFSFALQNLLPLVACLLISDSLLRRFGLFERIGPMAHHLLIIVIAGVLAESLEWLFQLRLLEQDNSWSGWGLEVIEGCAFAAVFWSVCLLIRAALQRASGPKATDDTSPPAGFLGLLPASLRNDIRWMKAEGNYVGVHGPNSSELINYGFSRAIEEAGPLGLQVHRSYWVAIDAVDRLERKSDRTFVVLDSQERLPVSRSFLRDVKRHIRAN